MKESFLGLSERRYRYGFEGDFSFRREAVVELTVFLVSDISKFSKR